MPCFGGRSTDVNHRQSVYRGLERGPTIILLGSGNPQYIKRYTDRSCMQGEAISSPPNRTVCRVGRRSPCGSCDIRTDGKSDIRGSRAL